MNEVQPYVGESTDTECDTMLEELGSVAEGLLGS